MAGIPHPAPRRGETVLAVLAWSLTIVVGLTLAVHSLGDHDLFLHDHSGQTILDGDGVHRTNTYSFTAPEHSWVNHEWLFQVLVAVAGNVSGEATPAGRVVAWNSLRVILAGLLFAVLFLAGGRGRRTPSVWLALPALATLAMLWTRLTLRPELVSYVLFVLVLRSVEAVTVAATARDWLDPRRSAGRAVWLTLLWAQFHGFYALAAVIWLAAALSPKSPRPPHLWRTAGIGAAAALLAGLFTPALVDGLLYPLRAVSQFFRPGPDLRATISELVPLLETQDSLSAAILVFQASLVWGVVWTLASWPRISVLRLVLWITAAIAAWQGQRHLGLYALTFFLLHTGLRDGESYLGRRLASRLATVRRGGSWVAAVVVTAVVAMWLPGVVTDTFYLREGVARRWGGGLTPANYPLAQAAQLGAAGGERRLANNIDAAATLIQARAGRVCIDGRTEAYPAAAWRDYAMLKGGGPEAASLLARWEVKRVVLAHRNPAARPLLQTLLAEGSWSVRHADPAGILFAPAEGGDPVAAAVLFAANEGFLAGLPGPSAGRSMRTRAADRCAAWASLLNLTGLTGPAGTVLRRGLELRPDHPALLHNRANSLMAAEEFADALELFQRAAALNRRAAGPLVNAAACQARLGRPLQAIASLEQATRRNPRSFEAWATMAELRRRQGDVVGAREAYTRALALREDPQLRARARSMGR